MKIHGADGHQQAEAVLIHTSVEETREYRVTGVPPTTRRFLKRQRFQPEHVTLTFTDGVCTRVVLGGSRLVQSGKTGGVVVYDSYHVFPDGELPDELPEWVATLVRFEQQTGG